VFAEDGSLTTTDYHATSSDVCDPLDLYDPDFLGTCTTARVDGHGRVIDQIQRNAYVDSEVTETHRLWSWYRADGSLVRLVRADTSDEEDETAPRPTIANLPSFTERVQRLFYWDSAGRRIGSDDPDADDLSSSDLPSRTWRYLFNRVGDIVAVRDPRGCGQNFYYDLGGRLRGEAYVSCAESLTSIADQPGTTFAAGAVIALAPTTGSRTVDVAYFYDALPTWASSLSGLPSTPHHLAGRATGSTDRGQRSASIYDPRGNAVWTARQMALTGAVVILPGNPHPGTYPVPAETAPASGAVTYDSVSGHTYVLTSVYDHAGRVTSSTLPNNPNYGGTAPTVVGSMQYNDRGLPESAAVSISGFATYDIVSNIDYTRDGLVEQIDYGSASNPAVTSQTTYDDRRRPVAMRSDRDATSGALPDTLGEVEEISDLQLVWDEANNLTAIVDERDPTQWPVGHRPQSTTITHDALYRVVSADIDYSTPTSSTTDVGSNWRTEHADHHAGDPMIPVPPPQIGSTPPNRVQQLDYHWDWQGNQTLWTDDVSFEGERSLGDIFNGRELGLRPSALYLATNIDSTPGLDGPRRGWIEVSYGVSGNVTSWTHHGNCNDIPSTASTCYDDTSLTSPAARAAHLRTVCSCPSQQHYQYRWDELNRLEHRFI
jgi:hypothetical protein